MNLQAELDAATQMATERIPSQMPIFEASTLNLKNSGLAGLAMQPGQTMTDFELPDATGKMVKSAALRARGPLLIVFYRGVWCPFCNLTLRSFQEQHAEIVRRGATLVAISPQTPDHSLTMQEKHVLKFPVLSDRGNKVARQFGIVFSLDPAFRAAQQSLGVDVSAFNGDDSFELPISATYLIGKDGTVLNSFVEADYKIRLAPEMAIAWLDNA